MGGCQSTKNNTQNINNAQNKDDSNDEIPISQDSIKKQKYKPTDPFPKYVKEIIVSKEKKNKNEYKDIAMIPQYLPQEYFIRFSQVDEHRAQNSTPLTDILGIYSNVTATPTPDRNIKYFACQRGNFLGAFWMAYNKHGAITISPDDIWIQILKGFSQHINANSEKLRDKIVDFEGKQDIKIYLDYFDMQDALNAFQEQIESKTKPDVSKILKGNFSTTGLIETFVSQIALMETCKKFFQYKCYTLCGIQKVNLLGKLEDWILLKEKVDSLKQFGCEWWIKELTLVIDQFIQTYNNKVNYDFWDKIFTYKGATHGSGGKGPCIGGWFMAFYPYINNEKNYWFSSKTYQVEITDFSDNFFNVPFYLDDQECVMLAGFSGIYELNNNFRPQLSAAFASSEYKKKSQKEEEFAKKV